jgi:hypothetical protein
MEHMLTGLPARVLRALRIKRARLAAAKIVGTLALVIGSFGLAGPFTYDIAAHRWLNDAARDWSGWGNQLIGFDVGAPRQNLFSLARDLTRQVRVVDHGVAHETWLIGFSNFLSRGQVHTVADALAWFNIPLTTKQARSIGLCRPLDDLLPEEEIIIQADSYQHGLASWYGPGFHGRLAASGEIYNMYDRTAAHKTLPLQSLVRVVAQRTGNSTIVRINDRGPYVGGRIIDLSHRAKELLGAGDLAAVYIERLDPTASDVSCE